MKYIYTVIYRFEGITDNDLSEDKTVYEDETLGIIVLLTNEINRHCLNLDTGLACASLMLRGIFGSEKVQEFPAAIKSEIKKIQDERGAKKISGIYSVIIISGNTELDINDKTLKETDHFSICFDAIDKGFLQKQHKEKIHSIVSSLSMSTSPEYHAEKISSGTYFIDDKNKPLYSFTMKAGCARMILSKPIDSEKENEITKTIGLSISNQQLKTPFRLFTQSLETTHDKLRSFISAWTALEIFTNKVFPTYENIFITNVANDHDSHGVNQFLTRIKEVMKDKYRLTDKFSLIVSFLSNEIEGDIALFKSMKKLRDDISHGKEFNEEALPVEDARKLVAKCLKSHMLSQTSA